MWWKKKEDPFVQQIQAERRILGDSINILKTTTNINTFISRFQLCLEKIRYFESIKRESRLPSDMQRQLSETIQQFSTLQEALMTDFLVRFCKEALQKANTLKSKKGKRSHLTSAYDQLKDTDFFADTPRYEEILSFLQQKIDTLGSVDPAQVARAKMKKLRTKSDLILLRYLNGTKVGDRVPNYFQTVYHLDAEEYIQTFLTRGVLTYAPFRDTLAHQTIAALQEAAVKIGIPVPKGKKEAIIDTLLAAAPEAELKAVFPERYYRVTDAGQAALSALSDDEYYERIPKPVQMTPEQRKAKAIEEYLNALEAAQQLKPLGIDYVYTVRTAQDDSVCPVCKSQEGITRNVFEAVLGKNYPPFDECNCDFCRCRASHDIIFNK